MISDRHATEHCVLEALERPGCAVCSLNRQALDGWIDGLLRDGVTDVKSRLAWRASGGLCADHGRVLEERGNPLGVAILYHDLLTEANPTTTERRIKPRCPACTFLREAEARYVDGLAGVLVWGDGRQKFETSEGLCVPHVRRLLKRSRRGSETWTRMACAVHLEPLTRELEEVIRKHDYRFTGEPWGDEADAWRRAVSRWTGWCVADESV